MELKIDYSRYPAALVLMDNERTVSRLDLDPNQVVPAELLVKEASGNVVIDGYHAAEALEILRDIDDDSVFGMRYGIEEAIYELSTAFAARGGGLSWLNATGVTARHCIRRTTSFCVANASSQSTDSAPCARMSRRAILALMGLSRTSALSFRR